VVDDQEEEPEVEYVEGYEMEEEEDDMEDFGKGAMRMSDSEDGECFDGLFSTVSREVFCCAIFGWSVSTVYCLVIVSTVLSNKLHI